MKKNLLLIAALAVSMGASAQAAYNFMDIESLAFDGSVTIAAGTPLVSNAEGELTIAYDENLKTFNPSASPYEYISVNGAEAVKITSGSTGNTNGNSPLTAGVAALPGSGLMYKLTMKQTGFVFVLTKLNTSKNYYVMQGNSNLYAYALGVALPQNDKNTSGLDRIFYTLPEDAFGNVDMNAADASKYLAGEAPAFTKLNTPGDVQGCGKTAGEGSGFLAFVSLATPDAPMDFYYWAQGSKMANNGFIFVPNDDPYLNQLPNITFSGVEKTNEETGEITPAPTPISFGADAAGIENIAADRVDDANAPMYNVLGQRVNESYKGLVIKNGKKFINK